MNNYFIVCFLFYCTCFSNETDLTKKLTFVTVIDFTQSERDLSIFETSMKSIADFLPSTQNCEKILVLNGVDPLLEQEQLNTKSEKNKELIISLVRDSLNSYFHNTRLIFLEKHLDEGDCLREALELVSTPFFYLHRWDLALTRAFDIVGVILSMESNPNLKLIRICSGRNFPNELDGPVDTYVYGKTLVPLVRTFRFSSLDHISTVHYYNEVALPCIKNFKGLEDREMHPDFRRTQAEIVTNHWHYGLYIYGDLCAPSCLKHIEN